MSKKNLLVGQSGGPTTVINSSLLGVIEGALESGEFEHVYGMTNGIKGYLEGKKQDLGLLTAEERALLKTTPASYLGTCRFKLPNNFEDPFFETIMKRFEEDNIGAVFYIGGNDSMDTAAKLSVYGAQVNSDIRFIGVPKTIDNDLIITDHTPGYGSSAKFIASQVRQMTLDAECYPTDSATVIEIMGRDAGWLTAASKAARRFEGDNPVLIYLPETDFDEEDFIKRVKAEFEKRAAVVVCVSEGIHDSTGRLICDNGNVQYDAFGHPVLSGAGAAVAQMIREKIGAKTRAVELSLLQRASATEASKTDVEEAYRCGYEGVKAALAGKTGVMIAMKRVSDDPYTIEYEAVPAVEVCNQVKNFPAEWITNDGTDIADEYLDYLRPIITGESCPPMKDGLPQFLYRNVSDCKVNK